MRAVGLLVAVLILVSPALSVGNCSSPIALRLLSNNNPSAVDPIEREWEHAYAHRDTVSLNCILADEFQITSPADPDFRVHYKEDVLQWVPTRTGSADLEGLQVKSHGSAAVARGAYAVRHDGKLVSRFQFIDFFIYRDGGWQAMSRILIEVPVK
jgi:Domain of unknown function (DUF4440)